VEPTAGGDRLRFHFSQIQPHLSNFVWGGWIQPLVQNEAMWSDSTTPTLADTVEYNCEPEISAMWLDSTMPTKFGGVVKFNHAHPILAGVVGFNH
jgi:hypothetical protein